MQQNPTHSVASDTSVVGLVFMRRFNFFFWGGGIVLISFEIVLLSTTVKFDSFTKDAFQIGSDSKHCVSALTNNELTMRIQCAKIMYPH